MQQTTIPLQLIDPHPMNPRGNDLPDIDKLAESIAEAGVLQPILVRIHPLNPARFQIEAGHRRAAAARQAGLLEIPALVADGDDDTAFLNLIATQTQVVDFTDSEKAIGLQGVLSLGNVSDDRAAAVVGVDAETLRAARKGRSIVNKAKVQQASLDELAALAEFEGDPDAVLRLERNIGSPNFEWTLKDMRRQRDWAAKQDALIAELEARGACQVDYDREKHHDINGLVDENGKPVKYANIPAEVPLMWRRIGSSDVQIIVTNETAAELGWRGRYEETPEQRGQREEREAERKAKAEAEEAATDKRYAFLGTLVDKPAPALMALVWKAIEECGWPGFTLEPEADQRILGTSDTTPERKVMAAVLEGADVFYLRDDALPEWFEVLARRGYEPTDYEKQLIAEAQGECDEGEAA